MPNSNRSTAALHSPAGELHRLVERLRHPFAPAGAEEVVLASDEVRSVHVGHHPMTFEVLEGEVLVTCEGDVEDHVLRAGETFRTERRGHHVLAGFAPSRVRVAEAVVRKAA